MTAEEKKIVENSFDHLVGALRFTPYTKNYREAMELATILTNEGYLLERHSSWEYDEYSDHIVCNACFRKALTNPDVSDEIMLTDYCPHCGAKMNSGNNK